MNTRCWPRPNLNGDYISDACAAQVGGLGIAPGANIGDGYAIFEATHGTAPKYADKDVINPGSVILSGVMMFRFFGWPEAADLIEQSLERTIEQKKVTYDFERLMEGATKVKTSEFATCMIENMARRSRRGLIRIRVCLQAYRGLLGSAGFGKGTTSVVPPRVKIIRALAPERIISCARK